MATTGFDVGAPTQPRFNAYGLATYPDRRDAEMDLFVADLRSGGRAAIGSAIAGISEASRRVLLVYAERAATRAVRNTDRELLFSGLVAAVVGGLDQNALEALIRMPLLEDASRRLGIEPADVFGEVAEAVGHPGSVNLMVWLSRAPEDRTLECMGFEAASDPSGFLYRWKG